MISLVNTPRLDMHLQNAMTYAKLKGRTKGVTFGFLLKLDLF